MKVEVRPKEPFRFAVLAGRPCSFEFDLLMEFFQIVAFRDIDSVGVGLEEVGTEVKPGGTIES